MVFCSTASAQSRSPRTVLTVHWGSEDYPTNPVLDSSIRDALLSRPDAVIDYYAEYPESESFSAEDASLALHDYIHRKYGGRRIDVVVASADPALEFVLRFRPELFPDAAVVYRGVAPVDPALREAGAGLTGIRTSENLADTLQLALRLHPATERVLVVAQAPSVKLQESLRAALGVAEHPVAIDVLTEASLPRLIAAIRAAPSRSVILYVRYSQQAPNFLIPSDVARMVAEASPVPVYGASDLYIGSGVIGGAVDPNTRARHSHGTDGEPDSGWRPASGHPDRRRSRRSGLRLASAAALGHQRKRVAGGQRRSSSGSPASGSSTGRTFSVAC